MMSLVVNEVPYGNSESFTKKKARYRKMDISAVEITGSYYLETIRTLGVQDQKDWYHNHWNKNFVSSEHILMLSTYQ